MLLKCHSFLTPFLAHNHTLRESRAPSHKQLAVFDTLEPKLSSFKFVLNWHSKFTSEACINPLKLHKVRKPEKWEQFSNPLNALVVIFLQLHKFTPVWRSMAVTVIAVPCCQLSYIPHIFWHCNLLDLEITSNVMKRNWRLRIILQTVTVEAWLWKLISCHYFSSIKKVYQVFCHWDNHSSVQSKIIVKS